MEKQKEIIFLAKEDEDGGYIAWAEGYNIFTQADSWDELLEMIKDAVRCHFEDENLPFLTSLHDINASHCQEYKMPIIIKKHFSFPY